MGEERESKPKYGRKVGAGWELGGEAGRTIRGRNCTRLPPESGKAGYNFDEIYCFPPVISACLSRPLLLVPTRCSFCVRTVRTLAVS